jgi:hypothetical protein
VVELQVRNPPTVRFDRYTLVKELRGHPVGDAFVAKLRTRLEALVPQRATGAASTDAERVTALQARMLLDGMLQDLPLYKIALLSNGALGDAELAALLDALNR